MRLIFIIVLAALTTSCVHFPGGIAPSTTPIEGRKYKVLGKTTGTDSHVKVLWIFPVSGSNSVRTAIENAIEKKGGDALIEVTIDFYSQWWILFSTYTITAEGYVIKFLE